VTDRVIAVTGANGYVGSRLVAELAAEGTAARALARTRRDWVATDDVRLVDLAAHVAPIADALAGATTVVHLAGHNEVVAAEDPDRALGETAVMARHVVEAAAQAGVERVLFVSTVHVYGDHLVPGAEVDEATPTAPHGTYGIARLAVEHVVGEAPDPVVLRLTNAVGAPVHPEVDRWTLVALDLCRSAAATGTLTLRSSGQQWRDFIDLGDVVRMIAAACDPATVPAGTYNLASGRPCTVRALAELIQDRYEHATGTRPTLVAPDRDGPDPAPYHVDPSRRAASGLVADRPLESSIDELVELCLNTYEGDRN
jgi:UDP-glucose 4-epimerase